MTHLPFKLAFSQSIFIEQNFTIILCFIPVLLGAGALLATRTISDTVILTNSRVQFVIHVYI